VARSYSRALDTLVPQKATFKSGVNQIRSPGDATYDAAMSYLTTKDKSTGLTPVDLYVRKQKAWADSQSTWDQAKIDAQGRNLYSMLRMCQAHRFMQPAPWIRTPEIS